MVAEHDPEWRTAVSVRSDVELERSLIERLEREPRRRSIWVTDLVDPRTAYYRQTAPMPIAPERAARMEAGRELHETIGAALAEAPHLEVRVQRDGIVGQIDLFDELPTELKTTGSLVDAEGIRRGRPAYLEQLGLYCALTDRHAGRLLLASSEVAHDLRVFDTEFSDLTGVWADATQGAEALRRALDLGTPEGLPGCAWRGRGCPYEDGRVCDCEGTEPPHSYPIAARAGPIVERPEEAVRLRDRWSARPSSPAAARRFRDLLYPRRTFFERTSPAPTGEPSEGSRPPSADGLYRRLSELLESGTAGEVSRVHPGALAAPEAVACYRGWPFLLKITRAWRTPAPVELIDRQPHYFLDLGLRSAAIGSRDGWLFLGYERAERPADRVRVYRVRFDPLAPFRETADARRAALDRALAQHDPAEAPPCPDWMARDCAYRDRCGCGPGPVTAPAASGGSAPSSGA